MASQSVKVHIVECCDSDRIHLRIRLCMNRLDDIIAKVWFSRSDEIREAEVKHLVAIMKAQVAAKREHDADDYVLRNISALELISNKERLHAAANLFREEILVRLDDVVCVDDLIRLIKDVNRHWAMLSHDIAKKVIFGNFEWLKSPPNDVVFDDWKHRYIVRVRHSVEDALKALPSEVIERIIDKSV